VRRTLVTGGEVTPPETESEGSRSEGEGDGEELDAEIKEVKEKEEESNERLSYVHSEVLEQGDSLAEALNGVELD
jgi:type III polyketide synthase